MGDTERWQQRARLFRNTKPWDRCRRHYIRAHPLCELCMARGRCTPADHVDHHTVPLWRRLRDGEDCFDRLRALCASCHSAVTAAEVSGRPRIAGCDEHGNPIEPGEHWR